MVVEWLTFDVSAEELGEWLVIEEEVWSRYLETCEGFERKEMWVERGDVHKVHAVIWWRSEEEWKRIGVDEVAAVDARLGTWFREPVMRVYDVVRLG
jgi:uncharacterized protein (TIGR03792 family)